jgi:hypothetical protein
VLEEGNKKNEKKRFCRAPDQGTWQMTRLRHVPFDLAHDKVKFKF